MIITDIKNQALEILRMFVERQEIKFEDRSCPTIVTLTSFSDGPDEQVYLDGLRYAPEGSDVWCVDEEGEMFSINHVVEQDVPYLLEEYLPNVFEVALYVDLHRLVPKEWVGWFWSGLSAVSDFEWESHELTLVKAVNLSRKIKSMKEYRDPDHALALSGLTTMLDSLGETMINLKNPYV